DLLTNLTLTAGNGSQGGAGGDIKNIGFSRSVEDVSVENFEATIVTTFGGSPLGSVTMTAGNGSGPAKNGGAGGSIIDVAGFVAAGTLEGNKLTEFTAGNGGDGD